ncbi:MAG: uracil-DNA glycosylase [Actinobacteria bacterium HGW-Actinobacteria-10]|nr:MAG: uracil-DNA glycosylase [Actinobacteria bacterium HGW-Actinobacteria-10]
MALACHTLQEFSDHIGDCRRCTLAATRTRVVVGAGDPHARVVIIGEAPGRNEDLTGEPFVGAAGKLLDELLASVGMSRAQVYIANIVKCRPPGNRNPSAIEVGTCTPFLREQLRIIDPRIVVTLGNYASRFILGTNQRITDLRGTVHKIDSCTVVPVFHPAAALYDRSKRDALFADFELIGSLLEGERS